MKKDFNPESFINIGDYCNIDSFLNYLKEVDTDPKLYYKILSSPSGIKETANSLDDKLECFLNQIADNPIRIIADYGEIHSNFYRNKIIQPLSFNKNFFRFAKIVSKLLNK